MNWCMAYHGASCNNNHSLSMWVDLVPMFWYFITVVSTMLVLL